MTDDEVLALQCPACGDLYGEHSLVRLAWCMEQVYDGEFGDDDPDAIRLLDPSPRQVERVDGPTFRAVLA